MFNPFCQRLRALGIFQDPICKKFPFRRLKQLFENEGWKANGVCIALSLPLGSNDKVVMHGILMHPCPEASARRITFLRTRGKFRVTHGGRRGKSGEFTADAVSSQFCGGQDGKSFQMS